MADLRKTKNGSTECSVMLLSVTDALYVLSGKWKLPIIIALGHGHKRFKELQREVKGITAKMLSKELRELEMNELVTRTVYDTTPVTVEYELTKYSESLDKSIRALAEWGMQHRKRLHSTKKSGQ